MNKDQLNELLDEMAMEVVQGILLKHIKLRIERFTSNNSLVEKLVRIIELRAQEFGA